MCISLHYTGILVLWTRTKSGHVKMFLETLQENGNSGELSFSP